MTRESIGQRLKRARESRGLTQQQAAGLLDVSIRSVFRWESGLTQPGKREAQLIEQFIETNGAPWPQGGTSSSFRESRVVTEAHELLDQVFEQRKEHGPYWKAITLFLESLLKASGEPRPSGGGRTKQKLIRTPGR